MSFKCIKGSHKDISVRLVCLEETCKCRLICEYCVLDADLWGKHKNPQLNFVNLNDTFKLVDDFKQIYQSFKIAYNSFKSLLQTLEQYTQYLQNLSKIYDTIYEDYSLIDKGSYSSQNYDNIITKINQFVIKQQQKLELDHDQKILKYMNSLINFGNEQSLPFQIIGIITELNRTLFIQPDDLEYFNRKMKI